MIITRVLSSILGGGLLVFAVLMIGIVIWSKTTPPAKSTQTDTSARLSVPTEIGLLEAQISFLPDLGYQLDIHVERKSGAVGPIRPTLVLDMLDMAMDPSSPPLHVLSANEFHQTGRFSMPGRWRIQLGFGGELHNLDVLVRP